VVQPRGHFLLPCPPASPPKGYEPLAFWQANDARGPRAEHHGHGRFPAGTVGRYRNEGLLRRGDDARAVHWGESTVVQAKPGAQLSHHRCMTHHRLTAAHGGAGAQAGRGRWKIANANNNVLKTKGYPLEPNCGHGKRSLSAGMLSLQLLALLCHTVVAGSAAQDAWRRRVRARRQTFFPAVQACMRSMVFDNWEHVMAGMLRGLALDSQVDTS